MERNQETLSTRDLAPANDSVVDADAAPDAAQQDREPAPETPTEVYDREAAEGSQRLTGQRAPIRLRRTPDPDPRGGAPRGEPGNTSAESALADPEASRPPSRHPQAAADRPPVWTPAHRRLKTPPHPRRRPAGFGSDQRRPLPFRGAEHDLPAPMGRGTDPIRRRAPRGGRGRRRLGREPHAAARSRVRAGARTPRGAVGPWRGHLVGDLRVALQRYRSFFQRLL